MPSVSDSASGVQYLQVGVRRSGQHAIRGWLTDSLHLLGSGVHFASGVDDPSPLGSSWFVWPGHKAEDALQVSSLEPLVTLESFPLDEVIKVHVGSGRRMVFCLRTLMNWMASSYLHLQQHGQQQDLATLVWCYRAWKDYLTYGGACVKVWFEPWVLSREYRVQIAEELGIEEYDGAGYHEVVDRPYDRELDEGVELVTRCAGVMGDARFTRLVADTLMIVERSKMLPRRLRGLVK